MDFKVVMEKDEDNWLVATVPSLPGCISQGKTEKEALKNIREAISLHIKALAEDGLPLKRGNGTKEVLVRVAV
jgi:predicted RNase H-like HicB family nuclease